LTFKDVGKSAFLSVKNPRKHNLDKERLSP
jgi:hypothetical protein